MNYDLVEYCGIWDAPYWTPCDRAFVYLSSCYPNRLLRKDMSIGMNCANLGQGSSPVNCEPSAAYYLFVKKGEFMLKQIAYLNMHTSIECKK